MDAVTLGTPTTGVLHVVKKNVAQILFPLDCSFNADENVNVSQRHFSNPVEERPVSLEVKRVCFTTTKWVEASAGRWTPSVHSFWPRSTLAGRAAQSEFYAADVFVIICL